MSSSGLGLKIGSSCFKNGHCSSGFCRKEICSEPTKKHDPCSFSINNCPSGLFCSKKSRTCIPLNYQVSEFCKGSSDCSFDEYCITGRCLKALSVGKRCKIMRPDLCEMGSECAVVSSLSSKCYELCSSKVPCSSGYKCVKTNNHSINSICIPKSTHSSTSSSSSSNQYTTIKSEEIVQAILIVLAVLTIILAGLYGWIRLTRSGLDPRLLNLKDKKKRKRLRLNLEGNGLATITLVPSNCQSPQPVAASQLFSPNDINNNNNNNDDNDNYTSEAPPAYSEIINIR